MNGGYGGVVNIGGTSYLAHGGFGGGGVSFPTATYVVTAGGGGYSGGSGGLLGSYNNVFSVLPTTAHQGGGGGSFCGTRACDFGYNMPNSDGYATLTLMAS